MFASFINGSGKLEPVGKARQAPFDASALLKSLLARGIIHREDWSAAPKETAAILEAAGSSEAFLNQLVELGLLNAYQAARIGAGTTHGLVMGSYRILGRLGSGGLAVVFEAEHALMRHKVALKVMLTNPDQHPDLVERFVREMRAVAKLDHPNIVAAIDAGVCPGSADGTKPDLYYYAMEHLQGKDLETHVRDQPLSIAQACALIYQSASALDAAHQHQLIHRDIKPSNIFVTSDGNAKLLDFGLVRDLLCTPLTTASDLIGTLDYMAPEQARDAAAIDIRADVFGLGATLFYALVGQSPFPLEGSVQEILRRRQCQAPLQARTLRADVPPELEAVLARMMALKPEERYATPQAVMHALLPFLASNTWDHTAREETAGATPHRSAAAVRRASVLVIEPNAAMRRQLAQTLSAHGFDCLEACSLEQTLQLLRGSSIEAILLGVDCPQFDTRAVLAGLRDNLPSRNLRILASSARASADAMAAYLDQGADDCLGVSLSEVEMAARVKAAVRHKEAQDELDRLNQQLLDMNVELERSVTAVTSDLAETRQSLVLGLARLVEYRSTETSAHLSRVQRYCAALAQEASTHPRLAGQITPEFIQTLECVAPLHDIGNVGLPDSILLKAGPLDVAERALMQNHTRIGADTLLHVAHRFGAGTGFLRMAIDVARHHHERYDGSGYPDGLAGTQIPLAARILAIADSYDALRSRRAQRPRLSHASALQIILEASPGQYDPILLTSFQACAGQFDRIHCDIPDNLAMDY